MRSFMFCICAPLACDMIWGGVNRKLNVVPYWITIKYLVSKMVEGPLQPWVLQFAGVYVERVIHFSLFYSSA